MAKNKKDKKPKKSKEEKELDEFKKSFENTEKMISKRELIKRRALDIVFKDFVGKEFDKNGRKLKSKYKKASHKTREIRRLRSVVKFNDTIAAIFATLGYTLAYIEYLFYYTGDEVDIQNINASEFSNQMTNEQRGKLIMNA